jgi:hypothetical protein
MSYAAALHGIQPMKPYVRASRDMVLSKRLCVPAFPPPIKHIDKSILARGQRS